MSVDRTWSRDEGVALCRTLETIAPMYGAHVALTGGLLYRDGRRKDCDIIIYRIRQRQYVEWSDMIRHFQTIGLQMTNDYGWCKKFDYLGKPVDMFDPEADGEYGAYGDFEPVQP